MRYPHRIDVSPPNPELKQIANQMLLRTEALRAHLEGLLEVAPKSIILLVADHLPPLPNGKRDYLRLGYREKASEPALPGGSIPYANFLLAFVDGVPRKLPRMRHFGMPAFVLSELSKGATCRVRDCDFGREPFEPARYLARYQTILGLASRP